ncbi:MAG: PQQ-binding-like beta-propeller repeat protein [Acidobacteriota bacterium]|nr:PQQ-binding-like beta-propeller repeat protein [Acidobacteriota bacterium]
MRRTLFLAFLSVSVLATTTLAAQWPQFRGPNGSGVGEGAGYPVEFSPTTNVAWKATVPYGQSSPVIVGGRLYVTAREGEQLLTIALDAQTGKEQWRRNLRRARAMEMYKANDSASPSAAADAGGVVSFFAEFGLVAYGTDGQVRWTHPMGPFQNFYGMSASPIIVGDLVVQLIDQLQGSYLVALDRTTGKVRWRADRPGATIGYATPMIFRPQADRADVVVIGSTRLDSYDLVTGEPRWWMPLGSSGSMGVALAQGDTLLVSTLGANEPGLPQWAATVVQLDKDTDGRISPAELMQDQGLGEHFGWIDTSDDRFITEAEWNEARTLGLGAWGVMAITPGSARGQLAETTVRWRFQKNISYIPTPLLYQGVFYMVKTGGIVTTLDPASGKLLKEGRATGALGEYYASPVAADGKVYVASQEGKITVLKAGAEWEVLAVNDLGDDIGATPALAGGRLYVRTRGAVYCFR